MSSSVGLVTQRFSVDGPKQFQVIRIIGKKNDPRGVGALQLSYFKRVHHPSPRYKWGFLEPMGLSKRLSEIPYCLMFENVTTYMGKRGKPISCGYPLQTVDFRFLSAFQVCFPKVIGKSILSNVRKCYWLHGQKKQTNFLWISAPKSRF